LTNIKQQTEVREEADVKPEWAFILGAYDSVIPHSRAIYCSGPITSGPLAFKWAAEFGVANFNFDTLTDAAKVDFRKAVVDINILALNRAAEALRARTGSVVINPAALPHCNHWTQADWRKLWRLVIERHVFLIVLLEGWEYSKGSIYEAVFALEQRLQVKTFSDQILNSHSVKRAIADAAHDLRSRGINADFHEEVLTSMKIFPRVSNEL
jgi:hypothetical protein